MVHSVITKKIRSRHSRLVSLILLLLIARCSALNWIETLIAERVLFPFEGLGTHNTASFTYLDQVMANQCVPTSLQLQTVYNVNCDVHPVRGQLSCCHGTPIIQSICSGPQGIICDAFKIQKTGDGAGCPLDSDSLESFLSVVFETARTRGMVHSIFFEFGQDSYASQLMPTLQKLNLQSRLCCSWSQWKNKECDVIFTAKMPFSSACVVSQYPAWPRIKYSHLEELPLIDWSRHPSMVFEQSEAKLIVTGQVVLDDSDGMKVDGIMATKIGSTGKGLNIDFLESQKRDVLVTYYSEWLKKRCCSAGAALGGSCTKILSHRHCDIWSQPTDLINCQWNCVTVPSFEMDASSAINLQGVPSECPRTSGFAGAGGENAAENYIIAVAIIVGFLGILLIAGIGDSWRRKVQNRQLLAGKGSYAGVVMTDLDDS